jgi:hypothetical protein
MTVETALETLRTRYSALLEDIGRGERVLWIGAGVSRDQVPDVGQLLVKLLTHLRDKIVPGVDDDPHLSALQLIIGEHLPDELDDFSKEPRAWHVPTDLSNLSNSYSNILATEVGNEVQDYLLWEAVDVRQTYGSPDLIPGPEHWLIAFLVHEGLLTEAVTTNWDGLIERAVRESSTTPVPEKVSVLMTPESFRSGRAPFKLYKAHGCAVLARIDEGYRKFLVAQTFDINTWQANPIFTSLVDKLRELAKYRESLMVGTSVQDSNLMGRIATATQDLRWSWDRDDPACLFAEPGIGPTQREVLKLFYRDDYTASRAEICEISATGMFSGMLLAAAVVHVVIEKLRIGIAYATFFAGSSSVVTDLQAGVRRFEDLLVADAGDSTTKTVGLLRRGVSSLVQRYFEPDATLADDQYKPVYDEPVKVGVDAKFRHLGLPELSVSIALLGLGIARGHWMLELGTGGDIERGVLRLTQTHAHHGRVTNIVITRDFKETNALKSTDIWASAADDLLVIQANGERPTAATRGLGGGLGSRRRPEDHAQRVTWLSQLHNFAATTDDLMDAFRAEVSA